VKLVVGTRVEVEIATALGACSKGDEQAILALGLRLKNVLSRLVR
jgi:hypothetical protein